MMILGVRGEDCEMMHRLTSQLFSPHDPDTARQTDGHAIAEAGFANDPSVVWLVLAIVGAGVDTGAAAGAIGKLAPAARLFAADGELVSFRNAVAALSGS